MSGANVNVCRVTGKPNRFFGKYKEPKDGKWKRIPGGDFPEHIDTRDSAFAFAERWYEAEIRSRELPGQVPSTWPQACDECARFMDEGYRKGTTKYEVAFRCKSLRTDPILSARPIMEHDEALVLAWLNALAKEEITGSGGVVRPRKFKTIRNIVKVVTKVYRIAQSLGSYRRNWELPTSGHLFQTRFQELRNADEEVVVVCPVTTVTKLIASPELPQHRRILNHAGALSGARPGELHGLQFKDVCREDGILFFDITKQLSLPYGKTPSELGPPKTKDSVRKLPVHRELEGELQLWMELGWARYVGREPDSEDFLFTDSMGMPFREKRSAPFQSDLSKAGCDGNADGVLLTRKSLRRTFATVALRANVRSEAITALLGHAPANTKERHYEDPGLKFLQAEINKIPGFFRKEGAQESPDIEEPIIQRGSDVWSDFGHQAENGDQTSWSAPSQIERTQPFQTGFFAEAKGFEPLEACTSLVFKTSAFDHSATPPRAELPEITQLVKGHLIFSLKSGWGAPYLRAWRGRSIHFQAPQLLA